MFVNAVLAIGLAQGITIPLQKPPPRPERAIAPIETAGPAFAAACKDADGSEKSWDMAAPPVRIHGNTYFVGTCGISAILIAGNAGHVLVDGGTEKGAELIAANIRRLGFRLNDVKLLLHSHEHIDHVGGMARLQQLTGASLAASPAAAKVFETGAAGPGDPQAGLFPPFRAARVGRLVQDGEEIRIGNLALRAVATPGHTPGALSWHWGSCDGGICRRIVYADSLSPISRDNYRFSDHPAYLAAYRTSLGKIRDLECDILLTPHPGASNLLKRLAGTAPLSHSNGCRKYADAIGMRLDQRLAKEAATDK